MTDNSSTVADPARQRRMRRRIYWSGGAAVVVIALCVAVFVGPRHLARYVVAEELDRLGIVHEGVGTIDIDVWEREISFGPVRFRVADAGPGQVGRFGLKFRLWNLFWRRAIVDSVIIEGIDLHVRRTASGVVTINGVSPTTFSADPDAGPTEPDASEPWHAALEALELRDSRLTFDQAGAGQATIEVDRLALNGFRTWEPDKPGTYDLAGRINDIGLTAKGDARPFADRVSVSLKAALSDARIAKIEKFTGPLGLVQRAGEVGGEVNAQISLFADGRLAATVKGKIQGTGIDFAQAPTTSAAASSMLADFDAKLSMETDGARNVQGNVALSVNDLDIKAGDTATVVARNVKSTFSDLSATLGPGSALSVKTRPTFDVLGLKMTGALPLSLGAVKIALDPLRVSGLLEKIAVKTAGVLEVQEAVAGVGGAQPLETTIRRVGIAIHEMTAGLAEATPDWMAKLDLVAEDARVTVDQGKAAKAALGKLAVRDIVADHEHRIAIGTVTVHGLQADLTERLAGGLDTPDATTTGPADQGLEPPGRSPLITIGHFAFADTARLGFADSSVSPPMDARIMIETLDIKNIDTAQPATQSVVQLKAKINEFTGLDVAGWASASGGQPSFDLKVGLTAFELPRFSAYAAKFFGMNLETGQLNLTAKAGAKQAALDSSVKINIKDLKFKALSAEEEKKLSDAVGMPVQTAVGLLQDSDNMINLTIPVGGTVTEPDVDLSDAIGQAVGGALKSLFPPTALASMLVSAGGGSGITFKPVAYVPGSSVIGPKATSYVDSLVTLLTERPKLSVRLCGRATAADLANFAARDVEKRKAAQKRAAAKPKDRKKGASPSKPAAPLPKIVPLTGEALIQAAQPKLAQLALNRTRSIRRYLIANGKALGGRVSECRSAFDPKDSNPPRVDVTL